MFRARTRMPSLIAMKSSAWPESILSCLETSWLYPTIDSSMDRMVKSLCTRVISLSTFSLAISIAARSCLKLSADTGFSPLMRG